MEHSRVTGRGLCVCNNHGYGSGDIGGKNSFLLIFYIYNIYNIIISNNYIYINNIILFFSKFKRHITSVNLLIYEQLSRKNKKVAQVCSSYMQVKILEGC